MTLSNRGTHGCRGLVGLCIDGATIRVPDSNDDHAHSNLLKNGGHRERAYSQARVAGLTILGPPFRWV